MSSTEDVLNPNLKLKKVINLVNEAIQHHETMRNFFFFIPPGSASLRRKYEDKHTLGIVFEFDGHLYEYSSSCNCSCKYVYFQDAFFFDGKKTTVTKFKNVLIRMEELLSQWE